MNLALGHGTHSLFDFVHKSKNLREEEEGIRIKMGLSVYPGTCFRG